MDRRSYVDAHCHFLNAGFAVREAVAMGWASLWGNYPHHRGSRKRALQDDALRETPGWRQLIEYVAGVARAGFSDCAAHFAYEQSEFRESVLWTQSPQPLVTTPLMMDIYFALDSNEGEADGPSAVPSRELGVWMLEEGQQHDFERLVDGVRRDVIDELARTTPGRRQERDVRRGTSALDAVVDEVLREARHRRPGSSELSGLTGVELSPGYRNHIGELVDLQRAHPDVVCPFLAVDPRRRGVMTLIDRLVNRGNGPFRGIKLYPPLGYVPTHPDLAPVYAYCAEHDVPITAHTSPGGFPNARNPIYVRSSADGGVAGRWVRFDPNGSGPAGPAEFFSDPGGWVPVLERYRDLRLNLAHFGGGGQFPGCGEGGGDFAATIIGMLETGRYPNLYCDMSYFAEPGLEQCVLDLMTAHPIVGERLLFGTDYVMIMLDSQLGGLRSYFNRFQNLPPAVYRDNARRFMGR